MLVAMDFEVLNDVSTVFLAPFRSDDAVLRWAPWFPRDIALAEFVSNIGISGPTARSRMMLVTASRSSADLVLARGSLLAGAAAIRAKGGIALPDRRGVRRHICGVSEVLDRLVTARAASATMV